jgi:uncharacterized membrane protein
MSDAGGEATDGDDEDPPDVDQLLDELEVLEAQAGNEEHREQVRETIRLARRLDDRGPFGNVIRGFDRRDAAEALVGSVVFGIPMVIEGGTLEAGQFIAGNPAFLLATVGFGVAMVVGLLYATDIQRVEIIDPFFGVVPRRVAGVVVISVATAVVMMTGWGRVSWAQPWLATCQTAVCFVGMAIGAALGDILPGS